MKRRLLLLVFGFTFLLSGFAQTDAQSGIAVRKIGQEKEPDAKLYRNFRLTAGGGYAYRLGKMEKTGDQQLDDFSSGLRNGYNLDIEGQYFFSELWGAGLDVNFAKQSKTVSTTLNIPGVGGIDNYGESNQFVYVAPTFVMRVENDKWGFYAGMGIGPIFYTTSAKSGTNELLTLNKTALGSHISISGERRISTALGAGIKLAVNSGRAKMVELDNTEQNISNFTLTAYISFRTK